jgi:probable rRNA maturation factor
MPPDENNLVQFRRAPAELRRTGLETFARRLRAEVAAGREFHCLITGDAELRRLNGRFLGRDYPTDVLSFPAGPALGAGAAPPLGEIAISARRAAAQAREHGHSLSDEVRILMLHGLLHLLGLDHETDRGRMARAEAAWRRKLGLPAGLIERICA